MKCDLKNEERVDQLFEEVKNEKLKRDLRIKNVGFY